MHFEDKNRPEGATWMPLILGRNALHFQSSCLPSWHHRQQKPTQQFFLELPLHVRFMEWSCSIWVLWDHNNSLQRAHDLQEIQNFMLHLGTGTRLTSEWEGQREWEPHDRKEHQGPETWGDMERQTVQGPGGHHTIWGPAPTASYEHLLIFRSRCHSGRGNGKKERL